MDAAQEISWRVASHEHREHTVDWYWSFGLVAVVAAVVSIYFNNFLLALIILIGCASIAFLVARGPREHTIKVDKRGLAVDGTRYPFSAIHSFWVEHASEDGDSHDRHLYMSMKSIFSPHLSLPIDSDEHADRVHDFLKQVIKEEEQGPHIGDRLAELFGI